MKRVWNWRHFFQSENVEKLNQWDEKHLGIVSSPDGSGTFFEWFEAADPTKRHDRVERFPLSNPNISVPATLHS
jgi:hypothetical protein